MEQRNIGLLAHVDAGKTTLSEAMLYVSGALRSIGRVDHGNTLLDTHALERARGITIFSKHARLTAGNTELVLVDTPGHVDFSAETERVLPILDCAVLLVSGSEGIQAHTLTLWQLLEQYQVPTFLFINKMDLAGADKAELLRQLQQKLSPACVDLSQGTEALQEQAAMCDEALLENYLQSGTVTDGNIRALIGARKLFPCCFGSALQLEGIDTFLAALDRFAPSKPCTPEFGALVYKISYDPQGNRLTWLKVTGGSLKARMLLCYVNQKGEQLEEKPLQLRLYSGDKFTAVQELLPGQLAAVTGLSATWAGQAFGAAEPMGQPVLEPVMTYRVGLPAGQDAATALAKLRLLEEEDPLLRLLWEDSTGQIQVQLMGQVQQEIFRALVKERFSMEITLLDPRIFYKETITSTVEGVGHFEPLRHYAEVHILLEPAPRGSGLHFCSTCHIDTLDQNYQNLILTHMAEKIHRGVLTGAPITDIKLTLVSGKAHLKHTEGGDMRQATYRAIRQGLMQAKSQLLEPWYSFILTVPTEQIGRAITDIRSKNGSFEPPEQLGDFSVLTGKFPAACLDDYAQQVAAYTRGRGRLQLALAGYEPCHNTEQVMQELGYDPQADTENTPDSVFCAHGSGFTVKWDQVKDYMHLECSLQQDKPPALLHRNIYADDRELERIMEREFGPQTTTLYRPPARQEDGALRSIRPPRQQYIIVDGYNIIFAWDELAALAKEDLDAARRRLMDQLSSYAGFRKCRLVLVFDGYKQKGNPGEKFSFHNIQVVYTREGQTGDAYIEALVQEIGTNYNIRVATSDSLVQLSSLRSGVLRMSARELQEEILRCHKEMEQFLKKN